MVEHFERHHKYLKHTLIQQTRSLVFKSGSWLNLLTASSVVHNTLEEGYFFSNVNSEQFLHSLLNYSKGTYTSGQINDFKEHSRFPNLPLELVQHM